MGYPTRFPRGLLCGAVRSPVWHHHDTRGVPGSDVTQVMIDCCLEPSHSVLICGFEMRHTDSYLYSRRELWLDTELPTYIISDCSGHSTSSSTNFVHKHGILDLRRVWLVILGQIECTWRNCSVLTRLMFVADQTHELPHQNFLCDRNYHPSVRGVLLKALGGHTCKSPVRRLTDGDRYITWFRLFERWPVDLAD